MLIFGLSARVLVPQLPEPDLGTAFLGTSILSFWNGLLVLLAAVVTFTRTGGAILLTVASAVSHDLYGALVAPGASAQAKVRVGRCAVVLFSAIPVVLAPLPRPNPPERGDRYRAATSPRLQTRRG